MLITFSIQPDGTIAESHDNKLHSIITPPKGISADNALVELTRMTMECYRDSVLRMGDS